MVCSWYLQLLIHSQLKSDEGPSTSSLVSSLVKESLKPPDMAIAWTLICEATSHGSVGGPHKNFTVDFQNVQNLWEAKGRFFLDQQHIEFSVFSQSATHRICVKGTKAAPLDGKIKITLIKELHVLSGNVSFILPSETTETVLSTLYLTSWNKMQMVAPCSPRRPASPGPGTQS